MTITISGLHCIVFSTLDNEDVLCLMSHCHRMSYHCLRLQFSLICYNINNYVVCQDLEATLTLTTAMTTRLPTRMATKHRHTTTLPMATDPDTATTTATGNHVLKTMVF
jgi:hypothetical protein